MMSINAKNIMNCNLLLIDTVKFVSLLILHFVDTILDFFEGSVRTVGIFKFRIYRSR